MNLSEHLKNRLALRRFPQGLILTGETRRELAYFLAQAYVCEGQVPPCGVCSHCRKAKANIHPDIVTVGTEGESLKVDTVRALRADAYIRPNEAERKVYLIEHAETMNPSGQNALLKLLEEGPGYAAFFFLVPNPEQLLLTLRSRCETLRSGMEREEAEFDQDAAQLIGLLCEGGSWLALVEFCVGLEKKKREELSPLLDRTIEGLTPRIAGDPKGLLPKLDALREMRAACEYTIGAGHLAGWLMAALTKETP